jgi:2',3'-cyclic-nucleotide 2'-phosphodiesterase (5'-nucleotidase family)
VRGGVVRVNESLPIDSVIAKRVAAMEVELEHDSAYAALFEKIGVAATPIEVDGLLTRDCALGDLVMDVTRTAANADVALSTSSSFRQAIDAGPIAMEELRAALPYDNEIVVYEMTGAKVKELLAFMLTRRDTDFFSQISGVRIPDTQLEDAKTYRVATTEYLAKVAPGYRDFFAGLTAHPTGLRIRDEVRKYIGAHSPVTATRDGRIKP